MAKRKPTGFEKKITVRSLTIADYDQLIELQTLCFPGMKPWTLEQLQSQFSIFPEGQICIEYQGKIVASSSSLILDFDLYKDWHSWAEIADGGFIRNHDPAGDTMYGIEIMVHPKFRGMRLARRLYEARKNLARDWNLQRIVIGGRIPGYGKGVIIYNGSGFYTIYGNLSSIKVKVGDKISGCRDIAVIPAGSGKLQRKVYFEVRKERTPLDPVNWLKTMID